MLIPGNFLFLFLFLDMLGHMPTLPGWGAGEGVGEWRKGTVIKCPTDTVSSGDRMGPQEEDTDRRLKSSFLTGMNTCFPLIWMIRALYMLTPLIFPHIELRLLCLCCQPFPSMGCFKTAEKSRRVSGKMIPAVIRFPVPTTRHCKSPALWPHWAHL